jgi:hypothetical protein
LHQVKKDYAEFYRSSMLYLAFISSDSLGYDFKLPLAVDISLAALLGEGIYNFAQLLMHPIVKVRSNTCTTRIDSSSIDDHRVRINVCAATDAPHSKVRQHSTASL